MAIDSSIYSMVAPQQPLTDPLASYGKVATVQNMIGQNQLQGLKTQQLQKSIADESALSGAVKAAGGDPIKTRQAIVAAGDFKTLQAWDKAQQESETQKATIEKTKSDTLKTNMGIARDIMATVNSPESMVLAKENISRTFSPAFSAALNWPETYTPEGIAKVTNTVATLHAALEGDKTRAVTTAGQVSTATNAANTLAAANDREATRHSDAVATRAQAERHFQTMQNPWGAPPVSGAAPQPGAAPAAPAPAPTLQSITTAPVNEDAISRMPPALAAQVRATIEGQLPLPAQSRNNPRNAQLRDAVLVADPSMIEQRNKIRNAYFGATQSKEKDTLTNVNQAYAHAGTLFDLTKAMNNNDLPAVNAIVNLVKGQTGSADVTNPEIAKQALSDELMRTFRGAGAASEVEAKRFGDALKSMTGSPAQQQGALKTAVELLDKRLQVMQDQYTQGMGHERFKRDLLLPTAKPAYDKLHAGMTTAAPAQQAVRITGNDGYNALPKGAVYVGPDGVIRTK